LASNSCMGKRKTSQRIDGANSDSVVRRRRSRIGRPIIKKKPWQTIRSTRAPSMTLNVTAQHITVADEGDHYPVDAWQAGLKTFDLPGGSRHLDTHCSIVRFVSCCGVVLIDVIPGHGLSAKTAILHAFDQIETVERALRVLLPPGTSVRLPRRQNPQNPRHCASLNSVVPPSDRASVHLVATRHSRALEASPIKVDTGFECNRCPSQ
jgi:hypothetical protein